MSMIHNRFVHTYADPAIAFPWWGDRGLCILITRLRHRGFGLWVHRERHWRSTLCVGLWWVWSIERSPNPVRGSRAVSETR